MVASLIARVVSEVIMKEKKYDLALDKKIGFEKERKRRTMLQEVETDRMGRTNCYKNVWR